MKKRLLTLLFAGVMALSFTACGDDKLVVDTISKAPEQTENTTGNTIKPSGYVVKINNVELFIGQNMKGVYDKIGETASIRESGSCKYDGTEKEYKFAHLTVTAIIEGDVERIFTISLDDDMVATEEGVRIGDSVSLVSVKYGASTGGYSYKKDNMSLSFTIKNDEVTDILYAEQ